MQVRAPSLFHVYIDSRPTLCSSSFSSTSAFQYSQTSLLLQFINMHTFATLTFALFLFVSTLLAQTPPRFTPSSSTRLNLSFGNISITPGLQIGINGECPAAFLRSSSLYILIPSSQASLCIGSSNNHSVPASAPSVAATSALSGTYLLTIVDPDAPTPQNPNRSEIIHLLQPSVSFAQTGPFAAMFSAPAIVPYARPMPPPVSDAHRYVALLFAQPANFTLPAGFNATNRMNFNLTNFAAQARLGTPIAANYFLVSNMTGTAGAVGGRNATGTVALSAMPTATSTARNGTATPVPFKGAASMEKCLSLMMAVTGVAVGLMSL